VQPPGVVVALGGGEGGAQTRRHLRGTQADGEQHCTARRMGQEMAEELD
jgi:hypothetical protein